MCSERLLQLARSAQRHQPVAFLDADANLRGIALIGVGAAHNGYAAESDGHAPQCAKERR
jgi:hypothetical protein